MTTTPDKVIPADWVPGPKQGCWTYEDYAKLPEDGKRYEIVNGVLYMAPAPDGPHQDAVLRIAHYFLVYVEFAGLGKVRVAPFDIRLASNVFQPDVLVVLKANLEKVKDKYILGAPDLVVEVASPSTENRDRSEKYDAYAQGGVSEYWIVNAEARTVELLVLEDGRYHTIGIFQGSETLPSRVVPELPVRIEQFFA